MTITMRNALFQEALEKMGLDTGSIKKDEVQFPVELFQQAAVRLNAPSCQTTGCSLVSSRLNAHLSPRATDYVLRKSL